MHAKCHKEYYTNLTTPLSKHQSQSVVWTCDLCKFEQQKLRKGNNEATKCAICSENQPTLAMKLCNNICNQENTSQWCHLYCTKLHDEIRVYAISN